MQKLAPQHQDNLELGGTQSVFHLRCSARIKVIWNWWERKLYFTDAGAARPSIKEVEMGGARQHQEGQMGGTQSVFQVQELCAPAPRRSDGGNAKCISGAGTVRASIKEGEMQSVFHLRCSNWRASIKII